MDDLHDLETFDAEEAEDTFVEDELDVEAPEDEFMLASAVPTNDINQMTRLPDDKRKTLAAMSNIELSALLSKRAMQLQAQAIPLVFVGKGTSKNFEDIAKREVYDPEARKKFPIKIVRPLPDNMYEVWALTDFQVIPRW